MMHPYTFGNTPAAEHLVRQLNSLDDANTSRSASKIIKNFNVNIGAIVNSVDNGDMSPKVAANLMRLLRSEAQGVKVTSVLRDSDIITHLTRNVVIGAIKHASRIFTVQRKIENSNQTLAKLKSRAAVCTFDNGSIQTYSLDGYRAGYLVEKEWIPECPVSSMIEDPVTADLLHFRSERRIARREVV